MVSNTKSLSRVLILVSLLAISLNIMAQTAPSAATPTPIAESVLTLIANYKRILSLQGYSTTPTITHQQHQEAVRVGEYLFVEDQRLSATIVERLLAHPKSGPSEVDDFLAALSNPSLLDADLFAVRGIVTEVAKKATLNAAQAKQIRGILKKLALAHNKYGEELSAALSEKTIRPIKPLRPAWTAYIATVEQQYPAAGLIDTFKSAIPTAEQQALPSDKTEELVVQARQNEWQGLQLEKGSVLLSFDDGPHPVYTKEILAILERYKVKAIFFQLGQNLGTVTDGHAELTRNEEIEKDILSAGHAIGNHSFTHPFLPKLDQTEVDQEIDKTQALLDLIIPDDAHRTHMFRAPYGARNSMILGEIGERGLRSVLWNIDSLDWSDPVPESIVHRILQELEHSGRGIILMHDIHPKTVIALTMLLDELIKRGYHFVHWDGGNLVATVRDVPETPSAQPNPISP
ncbi:peptidoglycan/xylan/chitin deacetylase (PgdA/CDA1 family) [Oxalobacteraceae bacterium GrIS 1.18]